MVLAVAACGEGPTPPAATRLAITVQPSNATAGAAIAPAVQVAIQTATGATVTTATNALTVAIDSNLAGGTLSGTATVSAVNGVAALAELSIDRAGAGYSLVGYPPGPGRAPAAPCASRPGPRRPAAST